MAVPSSGEISLGKIRQELQTANYAAGPYTAAATGLDPAENGTYATINTCSPYYPLSANPANMSEWYGYDHDAPCPACTASYYFYPPDNDYLRAADSLNVDPWTNLQADAQDTFTISMWVQPHKVYDAATGDPGYQRAHGLIRWEDNDNGYYMDIAYIPEYSTGDSNVLSFTISAGSGSSSYRTWSYDLDNSNATTTGVTYGQPWNDGNTGNVNANGFVHLVFVYNVNKGTGDEMQMYWNGDLLVDVNYVNQGGPAGLTYNDSMVVLGQSVIGGLSNGVPGIWYGWIGWFSFKGKFAADSTDVATLYNSGTPPDQTTVTSVGPDMLLWEFGSYPTSNLTPDYNTGTIDLYVNNPDKWTNSIYP